MSVGFFLLFKFYLRDHCFRKKRANELSDDDFEYTAKDDEIKGEQLNNAGKDKLGLDVN